MRRDDAGGRLPKGVAALPRSRGGRRYRAAIRRGKGVEVHLGLYETPWLAAFAYNVAAQAIGRASTPPNPIPDAHQPTAEQVRRIAEKVRRRLGLEREAPPPEGDPDPEELLTLFEVAIVGFWRAEAAAGSGDRPGAGLDAAARRIAAAAHLLFRGRDGLPTPLDAMVQLLARRLDAAFRRPELTRAVLDDDGDDEFRAARWLAFPDADSAVRGFAKEVRHLYPEASGGGGRDAPAWGAVLGLSPPCTAEQVRAAYRARSRQVHPDAGGSHSAFVRLQAAYEAALADCEPTGD